MTINDRMVINKREGTMARYTSLDPDKYITIRQAALDLFYQQGVENTNMQQIATAAGIAKGTTYLYYNSREALLDSIFNYCLDMHIEASMKDLDNLSSCSEKLKKRVENILVWNYKNPKEAAFISTYYKPINLVGTDNVSFTRSYDINKAIIKEGIEKGEFIDLPLSYLCTVFFSSVEAISTYARRNPHVFQEEGLLERMLETIVAGIKKS